MLLRAYGVRPGTASTYARMAEYHGMNGKDSRYVRTDSVPTESVWTTMCRAELVSIADQGDGEQQESLTVAT